jgi:quercetin dioxygenase-like cupin family protein
MNGCAHWRCVMQKQKQLLGIAAVAVLVVLGLAARPVKATEPSKHCALAHDRKTPTNATPAELRWADTGLGPMASSVNGDFSKGAHVTFLKFAAGAKTPLHLHSADYVGIVLSGNARHPVKGVAESEKILPPGSHWFMPANVEHVSECLPGAECVFALIQDEKFDFQDLSKKR